MMNLFNKLYIRARARNVPGAETWLKATVVLLLAAVCGLRAWELSHGHAASQPDSYLAQFELGSFLLAGLPNPNVTWYMPLLGTLPALFLNLGGGEAQFFLVLHFGLYLLVFCAGYLLRGYWAGVISLAAAAYFSSGNACDNEQSFYACLLLLVLLFLVLDRKGATLKNSALAGLAVGSSLLLRTPLFLFPPVLVLCRRLSRGALPARFLRNSLFFLAASYVLLAPWGLLNRSLSGKFALFDGKRGACNLTTGARGSIYTMEGDCRLAAGLGEDDSAFAFFVRETSKAPLSYALAVAGR
ncbi:MAG: hypothetical protein AB7U63_18295, partial [Porticoccaceae bacterium]